MSYKPTQIVAASCMVAALGIPIVMSQTKPTDQTLPQTGGAAMAFQTATSISADDHYIYVLGNGKITRIDKASGVGGEQLTPAGWAGAGAPPANGGGNGSAGSGAATAGGGGLRLNPESPPR